MLHLNPWAKIKKTKGTLFSSIFKVWESKGPLVFSIFTLGLRYKLKLYGLTKNIRFRNYSNSFQTKPNDDSKKIKDETNMIIAADKTNNFYKVNKEDYESLLEKNITKNYKKTDDKTFDDNTTLDAVIARKLELEDRIYKTSKKPAYITLKDHKPNFYIKPTCRLINPTKPEIGKISKQILARAVSIVRNQTKLNQWKNSGGFQALYETQ